MVTGLYGTCPIGNASSWYQHILYGDEPLCMLPAGDYAFEIKEENTLSGELWNTTTWWRAESGSIFFVYGVVTFVATQIHLTAQGQKRQFVVWIAHQVVPYPTQCLYHT